MRKIDTNSNAYKIIDSTIAAIAGYGASIIVNEICYPSVFFNSKSSFKRLSINLGKGAINAVVAAKIMKQIKQTNRNLVKIYNIIADVVNENRESK